MSQTNSDNTYNFNPKSFNLLFDDIEADFSLHPEGTWMKIRFTSQELNIGLRFVRNNRSHRHAVSDITIENLQPIDLLFLSDTQQKQHDHQKTMTLLWGTAEPEGMSYQRISTKPTETPANDSDIDKEPYFELLVKYLNYNSTLYIAYFDTEGFKIEAGIPFDPAYDIFRLFTYEPSLVGQFKVELLDLGKISENRSFRMSGLVVRAGDMFNSDALLNANLLLIPASDAMTVSSTLSFRVKELGIPQMENPQAGNIEVYRISDHPEIYAGYAYSVSDDVSSYQLITQLCRNISRFVKHKNRTSNTITGVNLPLLGTGAGGLDPAIVMDIYFNIFYNEEYVAVPVIVSIPSHQTFSELKKKYHDNSIPLIKKYVNSKPAIIRAVEKITGSVIPPSGFELDFRGHLISLDLAQCTIGPNFGSMEIFRGLRYLSLNQCRAENLNSLQDIPYLKQLSLRGSEIHNLDFLARARQLEYLDLGWIKGPLRSVIYELSEKLKFLSLAGNKLIDGEFLYRLPSLEQLDISNNRLYHLNLLPRLKKLHQLDISHNQISNLAPLKNLRKLRSLNMQHNQVNELEPADIFKRLHYLRAEGNPLTAKTDLILTENENHISAVQNYLSRQAELLKKEIKLPAKVLLMGNHASGKSSLLHYLLQDELPQQVDSTHIIKIQKYPAITQDLPKAIFYDFGGQDYYHGIYKAFLSGGAVHLLLWNAMHNGNQVRTDSRGHSTQDFKLDYWLAQKQYLETQDGGDRPWPMLLIQTHADGHPKSLHSKTHIEGLQNDFFVCLNPKASYPSPERNNVNSKALQYLQSSVIALIEENRVSKFEPQWYIDFLLYILKQTSEADHKGKPIKDLLQHYGKKGRNKLESLQEDLDQFHKQGLILYYRHHLPDTVWLNPAALVEYIHQEILSNQQIEKASGTVANLVQIEQPIIDLLVKQRVIYLHQTAGEYIIPNFLPLAKKSATEFELYTFGLGAPLFTLKFGKFIPFGLINQIICFFGEEPEEKKFWRDRIIFTLDAKAKIMINLDFERLEIKAYASFLPQLQPSEKSEIQKFLFYGIVGIYWNMTLLPFKDYVAFLNGKLKKESFDEMDDTYIKISNTEEFYNNPNCRPDDLFISLNEKDFISCKTLCESDGSVMIDSCSIDEKGNFDGHHKAIAVYSFQSFTTQPLRRRKNVAISYSKKDLQLVQKFRDYLIPLYQDELIDHPWYCTELQAGKEWDPEIQDKFEQADIIFFMISENLMSTNYVLEHEIKNAIDKYEREGKLKIVPILMVPYQFARKGRYDLSRFTALPYALHPVTLFDSQNEAWDIITQSIRIMIEKDLDPGKSEELPSELNSKFQKIIKMKMGTN